MLSYLLANIKSFKQKKLSNPSAICTAGLLVAVGLYFASTTSADSTAVTIVPGSYSSTQIYHSPYVSDPVRGYTSFTGSWIDPRDQSLMVAFGQATGPLPRAADGVTVQPNRDYSGLTDSIEYLRSTDAGNNFTKSFSDPLVTTTGKGIAPLAVSAQATTGLKDGTLIRRQNGEDFCAIEPTVRCTAYIQRRPPATADNPNPAWGSPQYLLDPDSSTYQLSRIQYLRDGRLVANGQQWLAKAGTRTASTPVYALLMISSDQGLTWTNGLTYFSSESYMFPNEWDIAELANGDLFTVFRSRNLTPAGQPVSTNTSPVRNQAILRANHDNYGKIIGYTMTDVKPAVGLVHSGHPELLATKEGVILHIAANYITNVSLIHYTTDNGATWNLLDNPAPRRGIYYPTSFETDDCTIYIFGHVGGDDDYGERDQSITMDKFKLNVPGVSCPSAPRLPDTTPPTVAITAPVADYTVSGSAVPLTAGASDTVGVVGVQFKVDGNNVGSEDMTSPYGINWNSSSLANGVHGITAVARDAAGNLTTSPAINVTSDNQAPSPSAYSDLVMQTPGLSSYWRLGESIGSSVAIDLKSGRNGTYQNGPVLGLPGVLTNDTNSAAQFDGVNDAVALPSMPASVDFTIEGWQKLDANVTGNHTLYGGLGTLRLMPRPSGFYAGVYVGGQEYIMQGNSAVNTDIWVQWSLVRSGSNLTLYRNGVVVATKAGLPATSNSNLNGYLGRQTTSYPTKGTIDEVAVYNLALSAGDIQAHYAAR